MGGVLVPMLAALVWTLATLAQAGPSPPPTGLACAPPVRTSIDFREAPEDRGCPLWMLADCPPLNPSLDEEEESDDDDGDGKSSLHHNHGGARHGGADASLANGLRPVSILPVSSPAPRLSPLAQTARLRF